MVYRNFLEGLDMAINVPKSQPWVTSKPIGDLLACLQSLQTQ